MRIIHKNENMFHVLGLIVVVFLFSWSGTAQQLTKQKAIELTLKNNFGILIAENNLEIAENNKGVLNSGYLPTVTGAATAVHNIDNTEATFSNGDVTVLRGAESDRFSASIGVDYTLFDGLGRYYNYKIFKEQYNLTSLQARETIENTILQLFTVYYEVARLSENIAILKETLEISKKRVTRSEYQFEYGQNTKLNILNARVDVVNDSINLLNANQQWSNAKRDLNVLLNEDLDRLFDVDTIVRFIPRLQLDNFTSTYQDHNVTILQNEANLKINEYDVKVSKSGYLPTVGLNGTYGWNKNNNNAASFLTTQTSDGLSTSVSLSWNLFDGGSTITNIKNAKITLENQELAKKQVEQQVRRDILNANKTYRSLLSIHKIQQQNVITNQNNFERSEEGYQRGLVTSIEFRQAQINLMNAQTNLNTAKYNAKMAELELLQLTGQLLNVEF
ncbi:TolC family protein [Aquimarina pacifica]|uniref:TolC family protein n=1 Tax=Aquimarina pacifica TaxID=1296415 RepID=UPI0004B0C600|nr:TolC family protein [Aquimarina pacifica]